MSFRADICMSAVSALAALFAFGVGTVLMIPAVMFVQDIAQTSGAIRRGQSPVVMDSRLRPCRDA